MHFGLRFSLPKLVNASRSKLAMPQSEIRVDSIRGATLDSVLAAIRPELVKYLSDIPDAGSCKVLHLAIQPSNLPSSVIHHQDIDILSLIFHDDPETFGQTPQQKEQALKDLRRDLDYLISKVNVEPKYPGSFGCDKDTMPEVHSGLNLDHPEQQMEVAVYYTPRDLLVEWLAGLHNHIPWELRFLRGEDIVKVTHRRGRGRWLSPVEIDPEYPPIPKCSYPEVQVLFGRDGPKARTPGVLEKACAAHPEDLLYYDSVYDLQAEWRAGKHEHIPLEYRKIRKIRRGGPYSYYEKYVAGLKCCLYPSDYPGRPVPLDEVPACDDPELARLWKSERQNASARNLGVETGRHRWHGAVPKGMKINDDDWWYPERELMMHDWLLGVLDAPFENRRWVGDGRNGSKDDAAMEAHAARPYKFDPRGWSFVPEDSHIPRPPGQPRQKSKVELYYEAKLKSMPVPDTEWYVHPDMRPKPDKLPELRAPKGPSKPAKRSEPDTEELGHRRTKRVELTPEPPAPTPAPLRRSSRKRA
ncbi:hypothetical protein FB451DRAFT_1252075 [Mycena latifolia]|nr:hypothetical protein FB451DRAFT_1252075 [Mycena latifolia]